jgi:hypothetical protein
MTTNNFNWQCSHCQRLVTISAGQCSSSKHVLTIPNEGGEKTLKSLFIVCPNPSCQKFTLTAQLYESSPNPFNSRDNVLGEKITAWDLYPPTQCKTFPSYVPESILADYSEACLIKDLSPKASATLARRCLQGIVRDSGCVKHSRLSDEIDQLKPHIDPVTWHAINAVRKLGNIGEHMTHDINLIIDVDPHEATLLINLIETLLCEWYVAREERKNRMDSIVAATHDLK